MGELFVYYGNEIPGMHRGETHMHTTDSDGVWNAKQLVKAARRNGLHSTFVTDHDRVSGSIKVINESLQHPYEKGVEADTKFYPGAEITSVDGDILALNIQYDIPAGMSAEKTIYEIRKQGGLAVVAHPGLQMINAMPLQTARRVMQNGGADGWEVHNYGGKKANEAPFVGSRIFSPYMNLEALEFYLANKDALGAATGGTDGHVWGEIGLSGIGYEGDDPVQAIREKRTVVVYDIAKTSMIQNMGEIAVKTVTGFGLLPLRHKKNKPHMEGQIYG